jgi:hypothetical protein
VLLVVAFREGVSDDALQFAGDRWIAEKVVGTQCDSSEIFLPVSGSGDNNDRSVVSRSLLESQDFGVSAIREEVLAEDDAEATANHVITRLSEIRGKCRGDADQKKFFGQGSADVVVGADDETGGNVDFFAVSMEQRGKGFRMFAERWILRIRQVDGCKRRLNLVHDALPPKSGRLRSGARYLVWRNNSS